MDSSLTRVMWTVEYVAIWSRFVCLLVFIESDVGCLALQEFRHRYCGITVQPLHRVIACENNCTLYTSTLWTVWGTVLWRLCKLARGVEWWDWTLCNGNFLSASCLRWSMVMILQAQISLGPVECVCWGQQAGEGERTQGTPSFDCDWRLKADIAYPTKEKKKNKKKEIDHRTLSGVPATQHLGLFLYLKLCLALGAWWGDWWHSS